MTFTDFRKITENLTGVGSRHRVGLVPNTETLNIENRKI